MVNPVVVEVVRSGYTESRHRGAVLATAADQRVDWAIGAVDHPVFLRSVAKPLQAVALVRLGSPLTGADLAIAAGSHCGRQEHTAAVRRILTAAGLGEQDLGTPAALPWPPEEYLKAGGGPLPIFMNCSGQHAAMLALCADRGWDTTTYLDPDHPIQKAIEETLRELTGELAAHAGVDGCGAPTLAFSLRGLARGFHRLVTAPPGEPESRVAEAMRAHPDYVSAPDGFDTLLMRAMPGLLCKAGAEGIQCVALPDGRVVALAVDDGGKRAVGPLVAAALRRLGCDATDLDAICGSPVLGRGAEVSAVHPLLPGPASDACLAQPLASAR